METTKEETSATIQVEATEETAAAIQVGAARIKRENERKKMQKKKKREKMMGIGLSRTSSSSGIISLIECLGFSLVLSCTLVRVTVMCEYEISNYMISR